MTMTEFINAQVAIWGQDYVDDLFDRNFYPVSTSAGWRWLYFSNQDFEQYISASNRHENRVNA